MAGFGETLHQARAHLGVTLKEAEQATRINRHHLAALEEENFSALPPLIYQRGIIRNYAVFLQLDPGKLLAMFEEAHGLGPAQSGGQVAAVPPIDMPSHWAPNFAIIAFAVVLSAIVFAWVYSAFVAQPEIDDTPTAIVPTATPFESDIPLPTAPPSTPEPTAAPTEPAQPTEARSAADPSTSTRRPGGDNQRGGEQATEPQDAAPEATEEQAVEEPQQGVEEAPAEETEPVDQTGLTSFAVIADGADLYVTVYADGEVRFDGPLADGQSTEQITGATFEVYTSLGSATQFINSCGDEFRMGDAAGEVTYSLAYDETTSCPPAT
jgi:cytoskeletal protein RodZ